MQFVTIRERQVCNDLAFHSSSNPDICFQFESEVSPDPRAETVSVVPAPKLMETCPDRLWQQIVSAVHENVVEANKAGKQLCCVRLSVTRIATDEQTSIEEAFLHVYPLFRQTLFRTLAPWSQVIALQNEWLTSDVIALARGIHATSSFDGIPALHDALLEAGCDDPLVMEHLRTCPDHAPSCWVVEMILDQSRS